MKKRIALTIKPEIVEGARRVAGLIPLSAFVEDLLQREIERRDAESSHE